MSARAPGPRLVAGNWKLHKGNDEAATLARDLVAGLLPTPGCDVVLCPPFTALSEVRYALAGTPIHLGGQDLFSEDEGAFTGEVSGPMLVSAGCTHVIVCLGETLDEREAGRTAEVVTRQFDRGPGGIAGEGAARIVLAYEPVWAIGTGRTATPAQAAEVHGVLRARARAAWGSGADRLRILYGGSVKPDNAAALFAEPELDGALVGGASLTPAQFLPIVGAAAR
ncbi:MAG: triose-phosphate isomerase [Candidatus Eisenbacteria bacterium]